MTGTDALPLFYATNITIDYPANRLHVAAPVASTVLKSTPNARAIVDIGANGRLIGIEIGEAYISVMENDPLHAGLTRSAEVRVDLHVDTVRREVVVSLPRRDVTHEISYPSGNQCWVRPGPGGAPVRTCSAISRGDQPVGHHVDVVRD